MAQVATAPINVSVHHLKEKPLYIRLQEEFERRAKADEEERRKHYEEAMGRARAMVDSSHRSHSPPKFPPIKNSSNPSSTSGSHAGSHVSKFSNTPPLPPIGKARKPSLPPEARGRFAPKSPPPEKAESVVPAHKPTVPKVPKRIVHKEEQKPTQPAAPPKKIDWKKITAKMPYDKTPASVKKRAEFFNQFDPNGNGYLSLAEVDKGMESVLGLPEVYDTKPVLIRAFQAARDKVPPKHGELSVDFIEKGEEFRLLFAYCRSYFELYHMFDVIDTSDDRRMDIDEFKRGLDEIKVWGLQVTDPEAEFAKIDTNNGGIILFDEFAHWAITHKLDLEDDDDAPEEEPQDEAAIDAPAKPIKKVVRKAGVKRPAVAAKAAAPDAAPLKKIDWAALSAKLPAGDGDAEKSARAELFNRIDENATGQLSLAEVDKAVKDVLAIDDLYDCKPAIMRAFSAAKDTVKSHTSDEGYVEKNEFRKLLMYLRNYFELFRMFDIVDSSDDRRVDINEFKAGLDEIAEWGLNVPDADAAFASIDKNGGGIILFDEFADWAIRSKLDLTDDDN